MTCALPVFGAGRLDHVGIDRALREPANARQLRRFLFEHFDEQATDDLALALRIGLAAQRVEEALLGIDADHAHAHVLRERLHHLVAFAQAQQAVIDEHAGQLLADRPMQQRADDGGIDAAGQAEQHVVAPDLLAHARDRVRDDVAGVPARFAAADLAHEALEDAARPAACA